MSSSRTPLEQAPRPGKDATIVVLTGEFDLSNVATLKADIDEAIERTDGSVELDLLDVTYVDSSALRVLLAARDRLASAGHQLRVIRASHAVRTLFNVCGLTSLLVRAAVEVDGRRLAP